MGEIFQVTIAPTIHNTFFLERPHMNTLLGTALAKPVTTIIAGVGYGKTQAVYTFLQNYDAIIIWMQLSVYDNMPLRLWEKFVHIISLQNEKLASDLMNIGFPETLGAYDQFLVLFAEELKNKKRYVLVYDDFYLLHDKSVLNFFSRFTAAQIPNLSIVFISRTEPDINVIGLLSKGSISNISEDDLRFSEHETRDYFQKQGIRLSSKTALDIYAYTAGWIFAIRLVDLSLQKNMRHENYALTAAKENIFKLIEKEVFSTVSSETQYFLITMSLIDDLPLELIKELSFRSPIMIAEIEKLGSFIRYDAFINTYRVHHLLLDFLIQKQSILKTQEKIKTYSIAAAWYEKNGYTMDAVSYYAKAKNYDKIADIVGAFPVILNKEVAYSYYVLELLHAAPEEAYEKNSSLTLLYIRLLINVGEFDRATLRLSELKAKYELLPATDEKNALLCYIYIFLGHISLITCLFNRKYEFEHIYKKAYDCMPSGREVTRRISLKSGPFICRVGFSDKGEIEKFLEESKSTFGCIVTHGCGAGGYELLCAEVAFFRNDFKSAIAFANKAIVKAQEHTQYHIENMAWFYLLKIHTTTGEYKTLANMIQLYKLAVEKQNQTDSYELFDLALGWFYSAIGQTGMVASWIKDNLDNENPSLLDVPSFDMLNCANYFLAKKKYFELLIFLDKTKNSEVVYFLFGQIEMAILRAVALYYTNEQELAFEWLHTAYRLAYPSAITEPFIALGHHMRTLSSAAQKSKNCAIPKAWLETICIKSSTYAKKLAHISSGYVLSNQVQNHQDYSLSKREAQILTDLCHGLTREEIAVNCNLSPNTIRSILGNIFLKLGAINTLDAVRIATLMKII